MIELSDIFNSGLTPSAVTLGAAYWFKRWVNRVDERLKGLETSVHNIDKARSISEFKFDELRDSIKATDGNVGKMVANSERVWQILMANSDKLDIPKRIGEAK